MFRLFFLSLIDSYQNGKFSFRVFDFRVRKFYNLESFRALKLSNLPMGSICPRHLRRQISAGVYGGLSRGSSVCADPRVRTPIGTNEIFYMNISTYIIEAVW